MTIMMYGHHIQMLLVTVAFMYLGLTSHFLLSTSSNKMKASEALDDLHGRGQVMQGLAEAHSDLQIIRGNSSRVIVTPQLSISKSNLTGYHRHLFRFTKNNVASRQTAVNLAAQALSSISAVSKEYIIAGYNVKLRINQGDVCEANTEWPTSPHLLIQIHSHCSNKAQRDAIRATWGHVTSAHPSPRVIVTFLLGQCNDSSTNSKITHEAHLYRDILQWDFSDYYSNLTLKSLAGLMWAQLHCNNAQYLLKADDDLYMNISRVLSLTKTSVGPLIGHVYPSAKPHRQGLWHVSKLQYPAEVYPSYCSGTVYLIKMSAVVTLLQAFRNANPPLIPVEDVYITGILATRSGLQCQHISLFPGWATMPSFQTLVDLLRGSLLAIHGVTYERIYHIHHVATHCIKCDSSQAEVRKWFEWIKLQKTYG